MGKGDTTVELSINDYNLALGPHSTSLKLVDRADGSETIIDVTADFSLPVLTLSEERVTLDISDGAEQATGNLNISLSTGTRIYPIDVTLPAIFGTNTVYASDTPKSQDIRLTSFDTISEGENNFTVDVSTQVGLHTIRDSFEITVLASRHALMIPDRGVALTQFPSQRRLSAEIDILDSYQLTDTLWTATSNVDWLTVTASGTTSDKLLIEANVEGLALKTLHNAQVSVTASDNSIINSESIQVTLWIDDTDPVARTTIAGKYHNIAADPVRPYVYISDGITDSAEISVYNSHTKEYVAGLELGGTHRFGDIKVSEDGRWLYSGIDGNGIAIFNLETFTLHSAWEGNDKLADMFELAEPSGHALIVAPGGNVYDAQTGKRLTVRGDGHWTDYSSWYISDDKLAVSLFANRFCSGESGLSPYTLHCYEFSYNSYRDDVKVDLIGRAPHGTDSFLSSLAINNDGSIVYPVGSGLLALDVNSMDVIHTFTSDGLAAGAVLGENEQIHLSTSNYYGTTDLYIYNPDGSQRFSGDASGYNNNVYNEIDVSGDGYQTFVIDDKQLVIMNSY